MIVLLVLVASVAAGLSGVVFSDGGETVSSVSTLFTRVAHAETCCFQQTELYVA